MSEQIKDGGPAFPRLKSLSNKTPAYAVAESADGMTLRDYFAAKAMPEIYNRVESGGFERVAKLAYEMADAMLAAREQA
ncbi:hypothetical protein [Cupriavidus taiwanensis]|uniref:hypothetical protein n=1 Tax=Cupriavidus taiwanensis TaxID=164546 RepID=UPI000E1941C2|nr:hypothetical protein [Cupriavidus taiwanensis]SPA44642.1 conserved hypothetical protein [Cupriavidus taiwanensis]